MANKERGTRGGDRGNNRYPAFLQAVLPARLSQPIRCVITLRKKNKRARVLVTADTYVPYRSTIDIPDEDFSSPFNVPITADDLGKTVTISARSRGHQVDVELAIPASLPTFSGVTVFVPVTLATPDAIESGRRFPLTVIGNAGDEVTPLTMRTEPSSTGLFDFPDAPIVESSSHFETFEVATHRDIPGGSWFGRIVIQVGSDPEVFGPEFELYEPD